MRGARRLLVWDVKGEWAAWPDVVAVPSFAALFAAIRRAPGKYDTAPGRYAFVPARADRDSFQWFASAAYWWGCAAPAVIVAEELPMVTHPGKAETAWGAMLRMGLGAGITIYALTQRPAESDKTTLGNASLVHAGRQPFPRDARYVAELLKLDQSHVDSLRPRDFIERADSGRVTRGRLMFTPRGRPYVVKPAVLRPADDAGDSPTRARARA